jgi:signal transduction histidine kinase
MIRTTDQSYAIQPLVQQRENFARLLVHDMRNPLSGIVLYAQLLQTRRECTEEQERFLSQILAEAHRLRTLLEQMQSLNKLQQGQQCLFRQQTDLRALLRESISKCESAAALQNKELCVTIPTAPIPKLLVNRPLLQHQLTILLNHAIHFTPERGLITVEMGVTVDVIHRSSLYKESRRPLVQLTITDQGPPLPAQVLPDLYEFVEVWDVIVSYRAGIGLSLALCQMIAEAHEGTLIITNHPPQGVCYRLTLPIPDSEWAPYASDC